MDLPPRDHPEVRWRVEVLAERYDPTALQTPRTWVVRPDVLVVWTPAADPPPLRVPPPPPPKRAKNTPLAEGEKRARTKGEFVAYEVHRERYLKQRAQRREECAAAWAEGLETVACAGCGEPVPSPHLYCGYCLVAQDVIRTAILPGDAAGSETVQDH